MVENVENKAQMQPVSDLENRLREECRQLTKQIEQMTNEIKGHVAETQRLVSQANQLHAQIVSTEERLTHASAEIKSYAKETSRLNTLAVARMNTIEELKDLHASVVEKILNKI